MKKLLSLALALVLCMGLCVPALAAGEKYEELTIKDTSDLTITFEAAYIKKETALVEDYGGEKPPENYEFNVIHMKPGSKMTIKGYSDFLGKYFDDYGTYGWEYSNGLWHFFGGWTCLYFSSGTADEVWTSMVDGLDTLYNGNEEAILACLENFGYDDLYLLVEKPGTTPTGIFAETPGETPEEKPEETKPAAGFTDVAADSPYAPAIAWAVEKNITTGKTATTFAPKETCNTAQILTFLWRAKGEPAAAGANPFTDVTSADAYYYTAALWAAENGLVSGGTFGEKTPCTRAAVVTYLWKLAGSPEVEVSSAFTDVAADADYAQAVAWAVENKITTGTSATTFGPGETCTRGQIVTFLYRAYAE